VQKKREIKTDITISLGTIDSMKKETSEALKNHHDILKVKALSTLMVENNKLKNIVLQ